MRLVKINAMWCPSCLIMNKTYEKIAQDYNLDLISYDYDFDEDEVKKYNIGDTLPVLIIFDEDIELYRFIGEKKYNEISSKIEELINENK